MTSFTLEQLQQVTDIYARILKIRRVPVRVTETCQLNDHHRIAHAHSDTLQYLSYRINFRKNKWNKLMHAKPISFKQYVKMFGLRKRRYIHIRKELLTATRRDQIEVMIHELVHFSKTPAHGKKFWEKVSLFYNPHKSHSIRRVEARAQGRVYIPPKRGRIKTRALSEIARRGLSYKDSGDMIEIFPPEGKRFKLDQLTGMVCLNWGEALRRLETEGELEEEFVEA